MGSSLLESLTFLLSSTFMRQRKGILRIYQGQGVAGFTRREKINSLGGVLPVLLRPFYRSPKQISLKMKNSEPQFNVSCTCLIAVK